MERERGRVDHFGADFEYGFITSPGVEEDVLFHIGEADGFDLEEGQKVEFEIIQTKKGLRAQNIRPV
jgi:CspA family cold shock protein